MPGHLVFEYNGRRWVGPEIPGGRGVRLYHRLMPVFVATGIFLRGEDPKASMVAAMLRLTAHEGVLDLVTETLQGFTVDGMSVDTSWDQVFAGRPADALGGALEVWEKSGFFAVPGVTSTTQKGAAPEAVPALRDAV